MIKPQKQKKGEKTMNMMFSIFGLIIFVPLILMLAGGIVTGIVFLIRGIAKRRSAGRR